MEEKTKEKCGWCGKEIEVTVTPGYCNASCRSSFFLNRTIKNLSRRKCKKCGTEFQPRTIKQQYCCPTCRNNDKKATPSGGYLATYRYVHVITGEERTIELNNWQAQIAQELAISIFDPITNIIKKYKKQGVTEERIKKMIEDPNYLPGFADFVDYLRNEVVDVKALKAIFLYILLKGVNEASKEKTSKDILDWAKLLGDMAFAKDKELPGEGGFSERQLDDLTNKAKGILGQKDESGTES